MLTFLNILIYAIFGVAGLVLLCVIVALVDWVRMPDPSLDDDE